MFATRTSEQALYTTFFCFDLKGLLQCEGFVGLLFPPALKVRAECLEKLSDH